MKRKLGALVAMLILAAVLFGSAHGAGAPTIDWYSVDGGGTRSRGAYVLDGAIGQPDASSLSSARFAVHGGFWSLTPGPSTIYLPITVR
jgi:hypothetical protein